MLAWISELGELLDAFEGHVKNPTILVVERVRRAGVLFMGIRGLKAGQGNPVPRREVLDSSSS